MSIIAECTGIVAMGIIAAAVVAYPAAITRKIEGVIWGIAGIFIVNLIRMVALFTVGSYLPGMFDTAHYIVGQSLMTLLAVGLWLLWLEKRANVV